MTALVSPGSALQVFDNMLTHQQYEPETFSVSLQDRFHREYAGGALRRDQLNLRHGIPIAEGLMNLVNQAFWHYANEPKAMSVEPTPATPPTNRHFVFPALQCTRREAWAWIEKQNAWPESPGYLLIPLSVNGQWSLLVGERCGRGHDL